MAAHLTEEEQIEAIKRWWQNNGKFTVAVILAAVLGWFGWSSWQDRQERQAQQASAQYSELLSVVTTGAELTDEQKSTARTLATELVESQPDTLYGNLSGLMLAYLAQEDGDLEQAGSHLRSVADNAANESMANLARLRLARTLAAQGEYEQALSQLDSAASEAYQAAYAEARGDIYLARNEPELAHTAYQEAMNGLQPEQTSRRGILQLKLENTRVAGAEAGESEAPASDTDEGDA